MKILAIDPSINNIGIAWKIDDDPVKWFEVNPARIEKPYGGRVKEAARTLTCYLRILSVTDADIGICEYPNFQVSQRGKIAAECGYTLDLAFVSGYLAAFMPKTKWYFPTPIQWKGSQPKHAIGVKFMQWTGVDFHTVSDHCYEAAWMIHWYLDAKEKGKL